MKELVLNNGTKMPQEGFGVFQIPDEKECERVVYDAIKTGYRLIDTAASYMNEKAVGKAIRRAIDDGLVTREELFVTSKLWVQDMRSYEAAKKGVQTSLDNLGLDYLDLYLLHQAMGDYFAAYRALEDAYKEGKLKAIGVSNFFPFVLQNFVEVVDVVPAVNQIELHPFFQQEDALALMKEYNIVPQCWAPLAEGKHNIFTHPVLTEIGNKYGKTPAQVALRWNIDRGVSIIPKSSKVERMKQNLDVWDFALTEEEMQAIAKLDLGHSEIINHFDPKIVKFIVTRNIHD